MVDEWKRDENGNVRLSHLMGCQFAIAANNLLICQLRMAQNVEEMRSGGTPWQGAMTVTQARELGHALLRLAEQMEQLGPPGTLN